MPLFGDLIIMDKYLVDVPVRIKIWCRPDCQKAQWDVIRKAKPSILFIQSDGGRNEKEWEAIRQNREMIDGSIDWDCTVYRFYETENLGMYASGQKVSKVIWENVDRCVFLEDDDIPSISFFRYCAELLEKYKDDPRIECICGHNHFGVWQECDSDYFFSRQGSIHGIASWKRTRIERGKFDYYKDKYVMSLLKERTKHNKIAWKRLNAYGHLDYFEGHVPGGEFWIEFNMYAQNRLQIVPKYNLINNVGLRKDSAHSNGAFASKKLKSIFNMKTYELSFPMKHAQYVIPDIKYEKQRNKVLNYNESKFLRICKYPFRIIKILFLNPKYFFSRLLRRRTKKKELEK